MASEISRCLHVYVTICRVHVKVISRAPSMEAMVEERERQAKTDLMKALGLTEGVDLDEDRFQDLIDTMVMYLNGECSYTEVLSTAHELSWLASFKP